MRKSGLTNSSRKDVSGTSIQLAMLRLLVLQYIIPSASVAPGLVMSMLILKHDWSVKTSTEL